MTRSLVDFFESDQALSVFRERLVWHVEFQVVDELGNAVDETEYLIRLARIAAGQRILDFGCGTGALCIRLAVEHGCSAHGVNISQRQIDTARLEASTRGLSGVEFALCDGRVIPCPSETFDAVLFQEALSHVPEKESMLGELRRVLKPGGIVAGQEWFLKNASDSEVSMANEIFRARLVSYRELAAAATAAGLSSVVTIDSSDLGRCSFSSRLDPHARRALENGSFGVGFFAARR